MPLIKIKGSPSDITAVRAQHTANGTADAPRACGGGGGGRGKSLSSLSDGACRFCFALYAALSRVP